MLDIAVVTSCHNYGRYLAEWAASIVAQTTRPAMVAIVDNGSTDDSPEHIRQAQRTLEAAGLPVVATRIERCNFGRARNAAVALAHTEWVMHLDADDVLMPHALADTAELAPRADVVAMGYERCGDLAAGPSNRTRVYADLNGVGVLRSTAPASGVSPFRRSFWQKRPYAEDMNGGWDTALWLGFGHLGARFRATKRPGFLYRQHADSIFNSRRVDRGATAVVGAQLQAIRRGDKGRVSILVPRRKDGGERDAAWAWLRRRYAALYPNWEVVEGDCPETEWRKGVAVNNAAAQATGDVFIVADSDCVLPRAALIEAVGRAGGRWAIPHRLVHRLAPTPSARILAAPPDTEEFGGATVKEPYEGFAGGGVFVVSRAGFYASGGCPTGFLGWGAEDETMATILNTIVGPCVRLDFDLWHLWHPPGLRTNDPHFAANKALYRVYRAARGNREAMKMIVSEQETPLAPGMVRMISIRTHLRGGMKPKGTLFVCSEADARQYESRSLNPLAARVPSAPAPVEAAVPLPDEPAAGAAEGAAESRSDSSRNTPSATTVGEPAAEKAAKIVKPRTAKPKAPREPRAVKPKARA